MCVTQYTGVPYNGNPPTTDGVVANDLGWTNAFRYVFQNGTTVPDGAVQVLKGTDKIYMSIEVNNDDSFDAEDVVVIGIDPDGTKGNYRRLHIFPFEVAPPANSTNVTVPDSRIKYWKGDPGAWGTPQATPPTGMVVKRANTAAGSNSTWSLEMELPIAALGLPPINYFGLYVSAFKVMSDLSYSENRWPENAVLQGNLFTDIETGTPDPSVWGNATFGGATCNGVYFGSGDISTNHNPPTAISTNQANDFMVNVHNSSVDSSGTAKAANGVAAQFKIADFGLPAPQEWHLISVDGSAGTNPTSRQNIGASSATLFTSGQWTLSPTEVSHFAPPNDHQCTLVELDSNVPDTLFINRSTWQNMNFQTTSSPFDTRATVGTVGYRLPEGTQAQEFVLTEHTYNTPPNDKWVSSVAGATPLGNGRYRLQIANQATARVQARVEAPSDVRINSRDVRVPPKTAVDPQHAVAVDVSENQLLTFVADGSVRLRPNDTFDVGPSGLPVNGRPNRGLVEDSSRQLPDPSQLPGTLVAWFDVDANRRIPIGPVRSVKTPRGAKRMFLAINDTPAASAQENGEGFAVQMIATPANDVYTFGRSASTRDPQVEDLRLTPGTNLPSWIVCGGRTTGRTVTILGKQFKERENVGCYGYAINRIGGK
ncbi:MAG TPA: hypothetical protein VFA27_12290 [Vicinamibacterales bacterium]|nr:hypothetical protein [Vicinamibacterales bacterium]